MKGDKRQDFVKKTTNKPTTKTGFYVIIAQSQLFNHLPEGLL